MEIYHDPHEPLLPGEEPDIRKAIVDTIGEDWLNAKNLWCGDQPPSSLIGTPDEYKLRMILRSVLVSGIS